MKDLASHPARRRPGLAAAGTAGAALLACWPAWWSAGIAARQPGLAATLLVAAAAAGLAAVAYPRRHTLWPAFVLVQASCTAYGVLGYSPSPLGYVGLGATGLAAWRERGRWRPALLLVSLAGTAHYKGKPLLSERLVNWQA
ncbi:MAG: hypothetical protein ACYDH5_12980 [Acidimicrobiales bacterium]